jgi:hypothetical protein
MSIDARMRAQACGGPISLTSVVDDARWRKNDGEGRVP